MILIYMKYLSRFNEIKMNISNMEDICIEFAEWVGINTFNGQYMMHEIGGSGIHTWRLNNNNRILTNQIHQEFCDSRGIEFSIPQKILYWDKKFEPTNFIEFIGEKNLFYYRWSYKGIRQESYWTDYKFKYKLSTKDLFKEFLNTKP